MRILFAHDPLPRVHALIVVFLLSTAAVVTATARAATTHVIPLFTSATSPQQSFARIINHSDEPGTVRIAGIDDDGERHGPIALELEAGETRHFNSRDLEIGNPSKGLAGGLGDGEGNWRLELAGDLNFEALAYIRTEDGFLTSMHDLAPAIARGARSRYRIATFNPGSNRNRVSYLRLSNPGDVPAAVVITGTDDRGSSPGEAVRLTLEAGTSRTLSAQALESGDGVEGYLGDGAGKWELIVETDQPIHAMSLLSSPTGHLTNLSAVPPGRNTFVPLFPAARRPAQGFVRVVNHSGEAGVVRIVATDDAGESYPPVSLSIAAGQTVHFNSEDLESGNAAKGVTGGTGAGSGDWRLDLAGDLSIEALAYIRTEDGFLTSMHDLAPALARRRRIAVFNPGSNRSQVSALRLINPGEAPAAVVITGTDDRGSTPGDPVRLTVEAGASRTLSAQALESGDGVEGFLGDGTGKWQLTVEADRPIHAMSLLTSPTGHLTNLSTTPARSVTWTNDVAVLEPVEDTVYQAQNQVPLVLEFRAGVSVLEIFDESGDVVYRAVDVESPLSSSIRPANLVHGRNVLRLEAQFADGSSVSKSITVTVQKEPSPESSLDTSGLFRLEASGIAPVAGELDLEVAERVRFMMSNLYTDGFVQTCAGEMEIDVLNDRILSADRNEVVAIEPGTTRVALTCGAHTQRITVTVREPTLTGIRIEPDHLLLLGVGAEAEVEVTEFHSSGPPRPSTSAAITVEDPRLLSIDGATVTALRPGRTSLTASVDGASDEIDAEIVEDLGGNQGVVTVRGGGVLADTQSFGFGTISAQLVLRPDTVPQDSDFRFELLDPAAFPGPAGGEVAVVAFDVVPGSRFERNGIVRIDNSFSMSEGALVSLSRLEDASDAYRRIGFASVSEVEIEAYVPGGGTYVLHAPLTALPARRLGQQESLRTLDGGAGTAGRIRSESAERTANGGCDISLRKPRPAPYIEPVVPMSRWENGIDLSHCDRALPNASTRHFDLLRKYRPVLKVKGGDPDTKSLGGELPVRVSDLVRQGQLVDGDEVILHERELGEEDARVLLSMYDRADTALHITHNTRDWRSYTGVPTVYGRAITTGYSGETYIALQYWMYYSGSTLPYGQELLRLPDGRTLIIDNELWHEGDVEFFQVLLDKHLNPVGVSSGQHHYGESRHWDEITKQDGKPVIYIAFGSHATHFGDDNVRTASGTLGFLSREGNSYRRDKGLQATDLLNESNITIVPALIEESPFSIFFTWKGRFGRYNYSEAPYLPLSGFLKGRDGSPAPIDRGPDEYIGLSMFHYPAGFHFTYLMPGSDFAGMVEALARARAGRGMAEDRIRMVIDGDDNGCSFSGDGVKDKNMPRELFEVFHSFGKKNLDFQQYVTKNCSSIDDAYIGDIGDFFNKHFGKTHAKCHYHEENISSLYRRYVVGGIADRYGVTDALSLEELFEKQRGAKDSCGFIPTPRISRGVAEEGESIVFNVTLDRAPTNLVTYYVTTYPDTAWGGGVDYTDLDAMPLKFDRGRTSGAIFVYTTDDSQDEDDEEAFRIYITDTPHPLTSATPPADPLAVATGTILDDDGLPAPVPHISDASATEGEPLVFTVTLDEAPAVDTTYYYATYRGTAGRGDYTGHFATALRLGPRQRSGTITVRTTQDSRFENDETFAIYVTDAESKLTHDARPTDYLATATGTIRDDDERAPPMPRISQGSAEEGESIVFTVTLDEAPVAGATYYYATYRGTAGSDDYTGHFATALTFGGGRTSATITVRTTEDTQVEDDETFYVYLTDAESKLTLGTPSDYLARATGTIRDDEPVTPTPHVSNGRADEGDSIEFAVVLDWAPTSPVTYYYATYRGTAGRDDYTGHLATALRFNAGERSKTITVRTTRDRRFEDDETFYVYLTDAESKLTASAPASYLAKASGTIRDDDEPAAPTPRISNASAEEGDPVVFTVTLSRTPVADVTYYYATYRGRAGSDDYVGHYATELRFSSGQRSRTITVRTSDDALDESDETFYVYLTDSTSKLTLGTPSDYLARATGTIRDDDETAEPTPSISSASAEEGDSVVFTVTLDRTPSSAVTYYYATYRGTAGSGDYTGHLATALRFSSGERTKTITVRTTEDTLDESDETFTVYLTDSTSKLTLGTPSDYLARATGTIRDDDEPPAPTPSISSASAEEGDSVVFTVTLDRTPSSAVTYYYATYRGTAGSGDYTGHYATALRFGSGERTKTITVRTTEDTLDENDETFTVYLTDSTGKLTVSTPTDYIDRATGTIRDDDEPAAPTPSISNASAEEGDSVEFTVRLDRRATSAVTYYYATYRGTAGSGDYTGHLATALRFGSGERTKTITVRTTEDTLDESDETFYVYLTDSTGKLTVSTPTDYIDRATGTIRDDDEPPAPTPSISSASAEEGDSVVFTVTLDRTPSSAVTYYYATYRGTAGSGDYTGHYATALRFGSGERTKTITVRTTEDTLDENDETFTVYLTDSTGKLTVSTPTDYIDRATGTIRDDDEPAAPAPSISNASAEEGDSVVFTVTLDRTPSSAVIYYYATYRGTAGNGDYTGHLATALRFGSGERTKTITVRTTEDTLDENDETFTVYLTDSTSKLTLSIPTDYIDRATGTIRDDDEPAAPAPSISNASAEEGDSVVFTVTLDRTPSSAVTYYYATYRGTAGSGDYTGHLATALRFGSGERTKTITVRTTEDALDENDETFTVYLTDSTSKLTVSTPTDYIDRATGTIRDDDEPAAPAPSISNASAEEGDSVVFTVTLDRTPSSAVTYYYATYRGTAGSGDYTGHLATALRFGSGERTKTITVRTTEDTLDENDETFTVYLTDSTNKLTLSIPTDYIDRATGTIRDDDEPPAPSISNASAEEGDSVVFTVTLDRTPSSAVTYYYATYRGTAGSGDYTGHLATALRFGSGERTKTITVRTTEDTLDENDETFTVYLTDSTSKLTLSIPTDYIDRATGTIRDDDEPPAPSISNASAEEGDSVEFTVTLDRTPSSAVTYYYATYRGTAGSGDYTGHLATALRFSSGERTKTITVRTTEDTLDESDETFYVYLTDSTSKLTVSTPTDYIDRATGTIRDDDTASAKPDLVVSSASLSDSTVEQGDRVRVDATVKNQGSGSAGGSRVAYYVSKVGTSTLTKVDDDSVNSLNPGRSDSEYDYIDTDDLELGSYFVLIKADYDNRVAESDENNNVFSGVDFRFTVTAPPLPDLIVSSASLGDTTVEQGDRIRINATVKNQGSGSAGRSRVAYYLGRYGDSTLIRVGDDSVSSLSAGESDDEYINADTDDLVPGIYFVLISADHDEDVEESDETNNIYSDVNFRFTVTAP